jgi:hypothetical protein
MEELRAVRSFVGWCSFYLEVIEVIDHHSRHFCQPGGKGTEDAPEHRGLVVRGG